MYLGTVHVRLKYMYMYMYIEHCTTVDLFYVFYCDIHFLTVLAVPMAPAIASTVYVVFYMHATLFMCYEFACIYNVHVHVHYAHVYMYSTGQRQGITQTRLSPEMNVFRLRR